MKLVEFGQNLVCATLPHGVPEWALCKVVSVKVVTDPNDSFEHCIGSEKLFWVPKSTLGLEIVKIVDIAPKSVTTKRGYYWWTGLSSNRHPVEYHMVSGEVREVKLLGEVISWTPNHLNTAIRNRDSTSNASNFMDIVDSNVSLCSNNGYWIVRYQLGIRNASHYYC